MFDYDDPTVTQLMKAEMSIGIERTKKLIAEELDLNRRDRDSNTALHYACFQGNLLKGRLLIQAGADITLKNSESHPALYYFEPRNYGSELKLMLDDAGGIPFERAGDILEDPYKIKLMQMYRVWRTKKDVQQGERIHRAIKAGKPGMLKRILQEGPYIEIFDRVGYSPVFNTVMYCHTKPAVEILAMLRDAGADFEIHDVHRITPLTEAVRRADPDVVLAIEPSYSLSEPLKRRIYTVDIVKEENRGISFYPTHPDLLFSFFQNYPRGQEGAGQLSGEEMLRRNRRMFEEYGAGWFLPFLERYLKGEEVIVAELEKQYHERHGEPLRICYAAR